MAGAEVPLGLPILSGAEHGWNGFLTEVHVAGPTRDEVGWTWDSTHVGVCVAGGGDILVSAGIRDTRYRATPGSITLFPRGFGSATIRQFNGRCRFVIVEMRQQRLADLFPDIDSADAWKFRPIIDGRDPQIAALLRSMAAEIATGCPAGPLYAESVSMALAAYLSGRYGRPSEAQKAISGGFSRQQRARVIDYIEANIDRQIRLLDLANLVGLSPRHAFRLFRESFGRTPHRYVTDLRLARARELLAVTRLPVVDVALSLGFGSQSHFSDMFRKETGETPLRYRQGR